MAYIDGLIPLIIGIALIAFPRLFTKSQGETFDKTKKKLKIIGTLLVLVGILQIIIKRFSS